MPRDSQPHPVVLFDGVCNLCNGLVRFVIARDPEGAFRFASLQSEVGGRLLERCGLSRDSADTIVLAEGGECHLRSTAALRIARNLRGPWPLLYGLIVVPRPVRDWVYRIVARHRYRWFGRRDSCRVPTEEEQERFLD